MGNGAALSSSIPGWNLEGVFWHFYLKFKALPERRSVSEAALSTSEVDSLRQWLSERAEAPKTWCDRTWQETVEGEVTASSREMFGALFLILASEICREECNEESVWPVISAAFEKNPKTHSVLCLPNGHPTEDCKAAMAAGAERLGLRSLIDRAGKQEYFDTLKLQIGFTLKGAMQRLPDWLRGVSQPLAVKVLLGVESEFGELKSAEFQDLWRVLQEYRRGQASAEYVTSVLEASPWVRPSWVPELLVAAKGRCSGNSEELDTREGAGESVDGICEPILLWRSRRPELFLRFDPDRVINALGSADAVAVAVDRQVVGLWTRHNSGSWRAEFDKLQCQAERASRPNLRPQLLSITGANTPIEIDLSSDLELGEPLLIFDAASGRRVRAPRLDPNRSYLFLCDPDINVPGALHWRGKDRSVFLLNSPLAPDIQVLCGEESYWQPQIGNAAPRRSFNLRLECLPDEVVEIGASAYLVISGVPENAREVQLLIGKSTLSRSKTVHGSLNLKLASRPSWHSAMSRSGFGSAAQVSAVRYQLECPSI